MPKIPNKLGDPEHAKRPFNVVRHADLYLVDVVSRGVDVEIQDPETGRTALSFAVELGNLQMTELFLRYSANVNIRQYSLTRGRLGNGPQINTIWASGRFPLHWAIDKSNIAIVELLLQHRANPNAANSSGRTALQEACFRNSPKMTKMLLEAAADDDIVIWVHRNSFCFILYQLVSRMHYHLIRCVNLLMYSYRSLSLHVVEGLPKIENRHFIHQRINGIFANCYSCHRIIGRNFLQWRRLRCHLRENCLGHIVWENVTDGFEKDTSED